MSAIDAYIYVEEGHIANCPFCNEVFNYFNTGEREVSGGTAYMLWQCDTCGNRWYVKEKHQCEQKGCQETAYGEYTFYNFNDDETDLVQWLCWDHAVAGGCCPVCRWWWGGGLCQQCIEENFDD